MRENGWHTQINAFIDPIGFILTHWLALMVWPNGVLWLVMLQSTNHHTYIYKASISLMWEHSNDFIGVAKVSTAPIARAGKPGGLLRFAWLAQCHLAHGQAFNEWTGGRCETSFRNCQEPVSNLKMMPLMPNKIHGSGAVKLKNSDMISGPELIWHGHLDVLMTARLTWCKSCQALSCP